MRPSGTSRPEARSLTFEVGGRSLVMRGFLDVGFDAFQFQRLHDAGLPLTVPRNTQLPKKFARGTTRI